MRTLTTRKNTGGTFDFATGWHTVEITHAKYGDWNGSKFLELSFKDYPETFTLRIYAKHGTDGEEFAIGNVFRFANAGIEEVMDAGGEDNVVIKIDDSVEHLTGHHLNVLFYKEGEYTRAYSSIAPTLFKNAAEEMTQSDVDYWKGRAERRFADYNGAPSTNSTSNGTIVTDSAKRQLESAGISTSNDADIPF
ncbi:TPA: hypothetical protein HA278_08485 [Candidatus Woesearchaeota archaeon]|nr:hypothetical protein [Candidatus Woesearchaeota archaeon]|tara:strand:- start:854 stop:1432 length:579 start_codon:yes stop_codon:yes gene_type:complete